MKLWGLLVVLLGVPVCLFAQNADEALWRHRNLGKAFYENAATQYEAVGEFKKALDIAPHSAREHVNYGLSLLRAGKEAEGITTLEKAQQMDASIPHTWFNLGIAYKRQSQYGRAIAQFEQMLKRVPNEAITHYNLGVLYKLERKNDIAVTHFEQAAALDENLAGPHFQLATAYRQVNRPEEAKKAMDTFRRIKNEQAGAAVQEDLEWSFYSEIYETIEPAKNTGSGGPLKFKTQVLMDGIKNGGLVVIDAQGDLKPDLLVWSDRGMVLFVNGQTKKICGLESITGAIAVVPGDFDNDGFVDVCVMTPSGAGLYRNKNGTFVADTTVLPKRGFRQAVWLDYDHDYDLDLFLLGNPSALFRNQGTAGFSDVTTTFPFVDGQALDGVALDVMADTQGMDLVVLYANQKGVLYRDGLAGKYRAIEFSDLMDMQTLLAYDWDQDGWTDLVAGNDRRVVLLKNDHQGGFQQRAVPK